ncbi:hypothetical protein ACOMHN_048917 [Nucella lapillus]
MPPTSRSPSPSLFPCHTFLLVVVVVVAVGVCRGQDVQYSLSEEQRPSSFVGNVARDINLRAQLSNAVFTSLQYSLLAGSSSHGDLFSINQDTSDLFTARLLDREILCRFSTQCQLDFKVGAVAGTYFKNIRVRVLLSDINDNSPRFNRSRLALSIPESVTVGASFSLEGAVDDDTGVNNSVQTYTLFPSQGPFDVTFTKKLDRTSDVNLIIKQQLDREAESSYILRLVASDGGTPPRTAELEVQVTILDDNDNAPEFTQSSYSVTIGENVRPGERILIVSARDEDEGVNAEIRYRLSVHQDSSVATLFSVGEVSGDLTLKQLPASGTYSVIVQAVDGGTPPKEAQVVVEVMVIDTTNNPPLIVVTLLSTAVPENNSPQSPVAHVSVEDPDSGRNGQVTCLIQSAHFDLRALEGSDMMVDLAQSLDREVSSSYQVALFCQDSGSPRLNATATFDVKVEDVNDNPPLFTRSNVTFSVTEGDRTGEIVYTLTATDRDLGQNADITYRMVSPEDAFYVLESSGSIVVSKELDRESREEYVFTVLAVDGGTPALSSNVTVTVTIEDVNDEVPQFSQDEYEFSILENRPAGTFVGVFNATDPDLGQGGKVSFHLRSSQPHATSAFMLQPNGTLLTRGMLDRESKPEIVFDVVASDQGYSRLSSWRKVKVVLGDENDNRPVFFFPGPSNHSLTLLLPIDRDTHLFTLSVMDADKGQNSAVSYSLSSLNLTDVFSVDTWTGFVWTKVPLTEEHVGTHNLTFKATDGGTSPLSSFGSLYLTVRLNPDSLPVTAEDNNAVIAISIVCATIFIAVVIVIVVLLLRRRGKGSELKYVNKVTNNNNNNNNNSSSSSSSNKEEKLTSKDVYLERQNTPSMFFTASSGVGRSEGGVTPKLSIGYPQENGQFPTRKWSSGQQSISPLWDPDPLELDPVEEKDEGDGGDLQILNRVTSLRLQQAFEHISSIKSQLITGSDTGKPYEWREIHVPGRPEDFNSLSSRGTTANGDSGLCTADEDAVFLNNPHPHPQHQPHPYPHPSHRQHPHPQASFSKSPLQHSTSLTHYPPPHLNSLGRKPVMLRGGGGLGGVGGGRIGGGGGIGGGRGRRSVSQPPSDNNSQEEGGSSQPESCSSLPNLFLKPGSDILVFRPTSATSCDESSPSMDDNCTTTSGSYSISAFEDPGSPQGRGGLGGGGDLGSVRGLEKEFCYVQDVEQWREAKTNLQGTVEGSKDQSTGNSGGKQRPIYREQWREAKTNLQGTVEGSKDQYTGNSRGKQRPIYREQWREAKTNLQGTVEGSKDQSTGNREQWREGKTNLQGTGNSGGKQRPIYREQGTVEGSKDQSTGNREQWREGKTNLQGTGNSGGKQRPIYREQWREAKTNLQETGNSGGKERPIYREQGTVEGRKDQSTGNREQWREAKTNLQGTVEGSKDQSTGNSGGKQRPIYREQGTVEGRKDQSTGNREQWREAKTNLQGTVEGSKDQSTGNSGGKQRPIYREQWREAKTNLQGTVEGSKDQSTGNSGGKQRPIYREQWREGKTNLQETVEGMKDQSTGNSGGKQRPIYREQGTVEGRKYQSTGNSGGKQRPIYREQWREAKTNLQGTGNSGGKQRPIYREQWREAKTNLQGTVEGRKDQSTGNSGGKQRPIYREQWREAKTNPQGTGNSGGKQRPIYREQGTVEGSKDQSTGNREQWREAKTNLQGTVEGSKDQSTGNREQLREAKTNLQGTVEGRKDQSTGNREQWREAKTNLQGTVEGSKDQSTGNREQWREAKTNLQGTGNS